MHKAFGLRLDSLGKALFLSIWVCFVKCLGRLRLRLGSLPNLRKPFARLCRSILHWIIPPRAEKEENKREEKDVYTLVEGERRRETEREREREKGSNR